MVQPAPRGSAVPRVPQASSASQEPPALPVLLVRTVPQVHLVPLAQQVPLALRVPLVRLGFREPMGRLGSQGLPELQGRKVRPVRHLRTKTMVL